MLQRTAQLEILREVVGPVHAEHRFSHLSVVGVAFERHVDGRSRVDDALVENRHLARAVVHGVVAAFAERHTARGHHDRALRHVLRTERNHIGRSASELSRQHEFVLLGDLLGDGHRRVVEFGEGVSLGFLVADSLGNQVFIKILTERLGGWEEDTTVRHGVALDKVESTVGMDFHIVVQAVGAERLDEHLVFDLRLWNISQINACGVALELHVEAELVFFDARSEVIDVFHHQAPVALHGVVRRVFQRLHEQSLLHIGDVRGELADLIGLAAVGVFKGDGNHLVGVQVQVQRNVAQGRVHRVFRRTQQSGALQFFVVATAHETADAVEHGRGLVDVTGGCVGRHHLLIFRVCAIRRHLQTRRLPDGVDFVRIGFAEVGQSDDVARVGGGSGLVCHPNFHAVDFHARHQVGQRFHRLVVAVAEVLREEEMSVFLVVCHVDFKGCHLHAALR